MKLIEYPETVNFKRRHFGPMDDQAYQKKIQEAFKMDLVGYFELLILIQGDRIHIVCYRKNTAPVLMILGCHLEPMEECMARRN